MENEITPELVLRAYSAGIFPMGDADGTTWYSADPRFIIDLENFHTPRRLARKQKQKVFDMRVDTDFGQVIAGCANREHTWITPEIIAVYTDLHKLGFAHSIEAFKDNKLAGGLYGISIGGAFMAESMFYKVPDASKLCLVHLVERLKERGFILLDAQFMSPETQYLQKFGGTQISQAKYLKMLSRALNLTCPFNEKTP